MLKSWGDIFVPIFLFSICVLGLTKKQLSVVFLGELNSFVFVFSFYLLIITSGFIFFLKKKIYSLNYKLLLIVLIPYVASVISYALMLFVFFLNRDGKIGINIIGMILISLFAQYVVTKIWVISILSSILLFTMNFFVKFDKKREKFI